MRYWLDRVNPIGGKVSTYRTDVRVAAGTGQAMGKRKAPPERGQLSQALKLSDGSMCCWEDPSVARL